MLDTKVAVCLDRRGDAVRAEGKEVRVDQLGEVPWDVGACRKKREKKVF